MQILESSQLLLNMVKREAACLDQSLCAGGSAGSPQRPRNPDDEACYDGSCRVAPDRLKKRKSECKT